MISALGRYYPLASCPEPDSPDDRLGWKADIGFRIDPEEYAVMLVTLDALLTTLSAPVTTEEQAHCWTPKAKMGMAGYFRAKQADLARGALAGDQSLVRGLDAWGVSDGQLYDDIMDFNRQLPSPD
jgi:hypothetical protein